MIFVLPVVYPEPLSITFIDVIVLFSNTGVSTAPIPSPINTRSGGELYSLPTFWTNTSTIFPSLMTGVNCAWEPAINLNCGCLSLVKYDVKYV